MLKYIFSFLYIFFSVQLIGQESIVNIQSLSKEDGLIGNSINSIVQDKQGFIWIATNEGINRYDGTNFKFYSRLQLKIKSPYPLFLYVDAQNNIWITSFELSVLNSISMKGRSKAFRILNPTTNEVQSFKDKFGENGPLKDNNISNIYQDKKYTLWLSTDLGEIFKFEDGLTKVFSSFNNLPIDFAVPTEDKGFWFTSGKFLFRIDSNGEIIDKSNIDVRLGEITQIIDGGVILSKATNFINADAEKKTISNLKESGLLYKKFNNQSYKKLKTKISDKVEAYDLDLSQYIYTKLDNYGNIWAYDGFKIDIIAPNKSKAIQTIRLKNEFITRLYFHKLIFDSDNRAWIPVKNDNHLVQIEYKKALFSKILNGKNISVRSLVGVQDSMLFIASYSGLKLCNKNTNKCKSFNDFGFVYGYKILKKDSLLWIGTHGKKLIECSTSPVKELKRYSNKEVDFRIPFYDSNGTLWLGHETGLSYLDTAANSFVKLKIYNEFESLKYAQIHSFMETAEGLWVAADAGLYLISKDKSVIDHFSDFPVTNIFYIHSETDDIFWLGTKNGGLLKWNRITGEVKQFTIKDGLIDNTIYAVLEDKLGYFWLPSDHGLMRFNPQTKQVSTFFVSDGLTHEEFNDQAYFVDENGWFYLGGLDGITYFKPEKIQDTFLRTNALYPIEFTILNSQSGKFEDHISSLLQNNKIILSPKQKSFFIKFALVDFSKREKRYAYKVEGLQKDWTYIKNNFIRFHYLPYGNYTLKIKGQGEFGQWTNQIIDIPLIINKPFYLERYFIISTGILVVILIYLTSGMRFVRLERKKKALEAEVKRRTSQIEEDKALIISQNKKLEELNNAKDHLFAIIGHELRGPLVYFQGMAKKLDYLVRHKRFEDAMILGGNLDKAIVNINALLDNLLNWGLLQTGRIPYNPENISILEITEDILCTLKDFAEVKGIQIKFNFRPKDSIFVDRNVISIIVRNLVINAIKFTNSGGEIQVNYRKENGLVVLDIIDNGVGMTSEQLKDIFDDSSFANENGTHGEKGTGLGLKLCQKLMMTNNGALKISSTPSLGTKVSLVFKTEITLGETI